jgi:hypothetical protein
VRAPNPFDVAADIVAPQENPYTHDPVLWVEKRRGRWTSRQQRQVLESVRDHRYTAVHSAHDLGKSFTAGNLAAWWIDCHPAGEAKVVTTAPTGDQVKGIVWQEILRAHDESGAPGCVMQTEWWIGRFQAGIGRKPSDYNPAAFQGIHQRYVLVIIDEACGIPKNLFDAADALVTNEHCRVLAIGNPDDSSSHFAEVCKPGSGWNVIHLDGLESPLFTDEQDEVPKDVRDYLLSPAWVDERKLRWGETSPIYQAKVRGLFPTDDPDGVVRAGPAARCRIPTAYALPDARLEPVELGVDVGGGGDKSVGILRRGRRPEVAFVDSHRDGEVVVGLVMKAIKAHRVTKVKMDETGFGHFAVSHVQQLIREARLDCQVVGVNFSAKALDDELYPNVRSEMWWEIGRMMCERGEWDLSELPDECIADLLAPKWSPDARGRTKVEPKDDIRKRLGRSPDFGDALLLAYYAGNSGLQGYLDQLLRDQSRRG